MAKTFRGGIVPAGVTEKKEQAAALPLTALSIPVLHLSLRAGSAMLIPCVSVGQIVGVGDRVAEDPDGRVPPVHSGVSGTVTAVDRLLPAAEGGQAPTVVIESDGKQTPGALLPPLDPEADREAIVRRMYEGGLVGMGGGGFPTYRKYAGVNARFVLINVCECEPFLAGDVRLAVEQGPLMVQGGRLLARAAGVDGDKLLFCTESEAAARSLTEAGGRVRVLPRRYPQGGERQLIAAVLRQEIPAGQPPSACGVVVSNAATAVAMADAARGLPLTHRTLTVSGAVARPCNLMVPIGTPFQYAAQQVTPSVPKRRLRYLAGGPMTGRRLTDLQAGIPKTCGGLILLESGTGAETACIRCGACVRVCPAGLMPFRIDEGAAAGDLNYAAAWQATACIACGCCSYICPAGRRMAARIFAAGRTISQREART